MFKKIAAISLTALTLSSSITTSVFALQGEDIQSNVAVQQMILNDLGESYLTKDIINSVAHDYKLLEAVYLSEDISVSEVKSDGSITFEMYFEGMRDVNFIHVRQDDADNIILDIQAGNIRNELIHTPNGKMILDGKEVLVEFDSNAANSYATRDLRLDSNELSRAVGFYHTYDPYWIDPNTGTMPNKYTFTGNDWATNKITLGTRLGNIAESSLISILAGVALGGLKGLVVGIGSSVLAAVTQDAIYMLRNQIAYMCQQYTDSEFMSLRVQEYAWDNNNGLVDNWIYRIEFFAQQNFYGENWFAASIHERAPT